ncbi:MAG TPA: ScaI family restriction endonuclease [Tepidisphaeraceae bacterium]|nr:ScaI family restriction endonuclease [Tepidisphaeraceae bacterium]
MKNPFPENPAKWSAITDRLLSGFPLAMNEIVEIVLASWEDIFHSRLGNKGYQIGRDIWPEPQIMGFLLHELIPLNLAARRPKMWRRGAAGTECDAVYLADSDYSFEIKTSSSPSGIFGNRSYAQLADKAAKKQRGSFFLAVNFGKFAASMRPEVNLIRFGWLDRADWVGQRAQSGQQARLTKEARAYKLRIIYEQSVE